MSLNLSGLGISLEHTLARDTRSDGRAGAEMLESSLGELEIREEQLKL